MPCFQNLKKFNLGGVTPLFDANLFCKFVQNQTCRDFFIGYPKNTPFEERRYHLDIGKILNTFVWENIATKPKIIHHYFDRKRRPV